MNILSSEMAAIVGAITGVASLIWLIYRSYADSQVELGVYVTDDYSNEVPLGQIIVSVDVYNIGRLPTTIRGIAFEQRERRSVTSVGSSVELRQNPLAPSLVFV